MNGPHLRWELSETITHNTFIQGRRSRQFRRIMMDGQLSEGIGIIDKRQRLSGVAGAWGFLS